MNRVHKGDASVLGVSLLAAVMLFAVDTVDRHELTYRGYRQDIPAYCETDTECEEFRAAMCEAARDDGSDSDYCYEEDDHEQAGS